MHDTVFPDSVSVQSSLDNLSASQFGAMVIAGRKGRVCIEITDACHGHVAVVSAVCHSTEHERNT